MSIKNLSLIASLLIASFITYKAYQKPSGHQHLPHTVKKYSKGYSSFQTQIKTVELNEQSAIIEAWAEVNESINDFTYQWHLPEGVLIKGQSKQGNVATSYKEQHRFLIEIEWHQWPDGETLLFHIESDNIGRTQQWHPSTAQVSATKESGKTFSTSSKLKKEKGKSKPVKEIRIMQ